MYEVEWEHNNLEPRGWLLYAIDDHNDGLQWTAFPEYENDFVYELINPGDTVKVYVRPEASSERAAMALRKIADKIERGRGNLGDRKVTEMEHKS
jgi:hypothetical protein